jgi:hypothetical protein
LRDITAEAIRAVGERYRRDFRWFALEKLGQPRLVSGIFARHAHDCCRADYE